VSGRVGFFTRQVAVDETAFIHITYVKKDLPCRVVGLSGSRSWVNLKLLYRPS
jgi:hypothetical protein